MEPSALLRLVSEGTRYAILANLRLGDRTVTQLVAALDDEQSNVSHHLATLRAAGLVASARDGRRQRYRLAPGVGDLLAQVEALAARLDQVTYTNLIGVPADAGFHGYG